VATHAPVEVMRVQTARFCPPDDALLLAASWDERCLGLASRLGGYHCHRVMMTVYDGESAFREKNIGLLRKLLEEVGPVTVVPAKHSDPLQNVRETVTLLAAAPTEAPPRIAIDVSTYTRKHFLQLLQGLDLAGILGACSFYHTEPVDFHTPDDEPISQGISSVRAIETFMGRNSPARDSLLVLFLGYEGRRAAALWEHVDPNMTLAVIADPPYRQEWRGRTEAQNRYLLSCLPRDQVLISHSLVPADTESLLNRLVSGDEYGLARYNYRIAPFGTKAQTLGIYRFWRKHRGIATIMYAAPFRYREEQGNFPPGRTWLIDKSATW